MDIYLIRANNGTPYLSPDSSCPEVLQLMDKFLPNKYLNTDELRYFNSCTSLRRKKSYLFGRCLIKKVVELNTGMEPKRIFFRKNKYGKPFIDGLPDTFSHIGFNLSHAGEMVVCAVIINGRLGADVEKIERNIYSLAMSFFETEEIRYLKSLKKAEREKAACRLWTMKEAYVKANGKGMYISFDSFNVLRNNEFYVRSYNMNDYFVSIAGESDYGITEERIIELDIKHLI